MGLRERSVPQRGTRELFFLPPLEIPRREVGRGVPEEAGDDERTRVRTVLEYNMVRSVDDEGGSVQFHNRTTRLNLR